MTSGDDDQGRVPPGRAPGERVFTRPWEEPEHDSEVDSPASPTEALDHIDDEEEDKLAHDDYLAATTREYLGLAEDIARADTEDFERQAVAASLPGVGSGLVGFDDVTGRPGVAEEDVEHEEQQRASDLAVRVGTGIVLVGLFIGSLLLGPVWFTGFVTAVMVISLGEFYSTARSRGYAPVALFGFLGVLGASIGAFWAGPGAVAVAIIGALALVALFFTAARRRRPSENAAVTVLGTVWVSTLAFAVVIGASASAVGLILLVVLVTASFDIGAFFIGRAFGHRPLAPSVSPHKTYEGLVGGVVTAVLLAGILSTLPVFPVTFVQALLLAAVVAVLAPLGDAAESVVKRALGVKDMGSILPGHGGMLDRIDAFLFVIPAAYLLFDRLGLL